MKKRTSVVILMTVLFLNSVYGQQAIDFSLTDSRGRIWNLFDELAKGKTVVLDFFFADCTPCQKLTPALAKLYSEFNKDSLLILGISDRNNNSQVDKFETDFGVNYPSAGTEGGGDAVTNLYGSYYTFLGWPTYAVVCPNREVHWDIKRDTNFVEMRQKIQECRGALSINRMPKTVFKFFPNPTKSGSSISIDFVAAGPCQVNLTSSSGQVIYSQLLNKSQTLSLPKCSSGIYYIEVLRENAVSKSKLIILNN